MSRIYVNQSLQENASVSFSGELFHYLVHVLRLSKGDKLFLFNGSEHEYEACIQEIGKTKVTLSILAQTKVNKESPIQIHIAQAIPKGQKLDDLISKMTELGITSLQPILSKRTIMQKVSENKLKRWESIARHASEQCGRTKVPQVYTPLSLEVFLKQAFVGEKILFYELETAQSFQDILQNTNAKTYTLLMGPEGGFTQEEVALALQNQWHVASLGKRILRTETVAPCVSAILQYVKGDLSHT